MKTKAPAVLFAALSLAATLSLAQPAAADEALLAQSIRRVENGLVEFNAGAAPDAGPAKPRSLSERMDFYKVPGLSIAVIRDNRIEWTKGYGVLKAGGGAPVTVDSLFQAASTTKAVIAALVLSLVREGKLDLDQDVNQYLRSWQIAENDLTRRQKVTLRLLLSHRAGLPATDFPWDAKGAPPTLRQVLDGEAPAGNKAARVQILPGSEWRYANIGYVVIQQLLEDVMGEPLERIAAARVFAPLGMAASTFTYPLAAERQKIEALPHDGSGAAGTPALPPTALAQGGLLTTPSDLARFGCELLLAYRGLSQRLLDRSSVRLMLHREAELDPRVFGFPVAEGLGVFVMGAGRELAISHPGQNQPGATCWLQLYPELGQGVVIMNNGARGDLLCLEIIASLAAEYGWPAMK